jgi:hypothetical protein
MLLIELKVSYSRNSVNAKELTRELTRVATAARTEVWNKTLPFGTDSLRVLPEAYWEEVRVTLMGYEREFQMLLGMGGASMSHSLLPYPIVGRVADPALNAVLQGDLQEREDIAEDALRLRMTNALDHVSDRMRVEYGGGEAIPRRFHDTLFSNLSSENVLYRAFNDGLFQSTSLYPVLDGVDTIAGYDPKAVRKDAALRQRVHDLCQDLINLLSNA